MEGHNIASDFKLLFITQDMSQYTERNTHYLTLELSRSCDLTVWNTPGDIQEILGQIAAPPDFILLNDQKDTRCPKISGLSSLTIPFGIIMHDLHHQPDLRRKYIEDNNIRHIFSIYRDAFLKRFPEYTDRMRWLPHFVNTGIFRDYGMPKEIDILMMGKIAYYYPLRLKMYETLKDLPNFVYHEHPGYKKFTGDKEAHLFIGERYAREISRSKIFVTCDSILHYPVIKYYEVLACNTLLLAPSSRELIDLGFLSGENFVEINKNNFMDKIEYYLAHEEERQNIAWAGYQMVRRKHSASVRALQLKKMLVEITRQAKVADSLSRVVNLKNNRLLAQNLCFAKTFRQRAKGLAFKKRFNAGEGLILRPCKMVHTIGMRFCLDVVFLSTEGHIIHMIENLKPYRISPVIKGSASVLELPAGVIKATNTAVGDRLMFT